MQAGLAPDLQISCLHLLSIGIQYILADPQQLAASDEMLLVVWFTATHSFTCLDFLAIKALTQLADSLIHHGHFHVALVQELLLLLELGILFLVKLVTNLQSREYNLTVA